MNDNMASGGAEFDDISPIYSLAAYQILEENFVSKRLLGLQGTVNEELEFGLDLILSTVLPGASVVITGSIAEGFGTIYTLSGSPTDADLLEVKECLKAVERESDIDHASSQTQFLVETDERDPGYAKLALAKEGLDFTSIILHVRPQIYCTQNGRKYLSSSELKIQTKLTMLHVMIRNIFESSHILDFFQIMGPAATINVRDTTFGILNGFSLRNIDLVFAIPFPSWPSIASEWIDRERRNGWPTRETIKTIVQQRCFLIPKGSRGSSSENLEWTFTFSHVEPILIRSMNDVMLKTLCVLKFIKRYILEEECGKLVSSYIIKTAVFWEAEEGDVSNYVPHNLLQCVRNCLIRVKSWFHSGFVPHYIIRLQNLIRRRVEPDSSIKILEALGNTIKTIDIIFQNIPPFLAPLNRQNIQKVIDRYYSNQNNSLDTTAVKTIARHILGWMFFPFVSSLIGMYFSRHANLSINQLESFTQKVKTLYTNRLTSISKLTLCSMLITKKLSLEMQLLLTSTHDRNKRTYQLKKVDRDMQKVCQATRPVIVLGNLLQHMFKYIMLNDSRKVEKCINVISHYLKQYPCQGLNTSHINSIGPELFRAILSFVETYEEQSSFVLVTEIHLTETELSILPAVLRLELECRLKAQPDSNPLFRLPISFVVSIDSKVFFYFISFCFYQQQDRNIEKMCSLQNLRTACKLPSTNAGHIAWNLLGYCESKMGLYRGAFSAYFEAMVYQSRNPDLRNFSKATPWHVAILLNKCLWQEWSKTS